MSCCLLLMTVSVSTLASACSNRCADVEALPTTDATPRVAAIGDSILAWSGDRCQSIPDYAALTVGFPVKNFAVNGARVLNGTDDKPAIPRQYDAALDAGAAADIVIVNGGGNDLNGGCECGECAGVLDAIVTADATGGAMVELVERIAASGARVVLVDYFVLHEDAWYGFDRCEAALAELDARYEALAGRNAAVTLVDLGDTVSPTSHPEAYAFDRVHPSDAGASLMGPIVAAALTE